MAEVLRRALGILRDARRTYRVTRAQLDADLQPVWTAPNERRTQRYLFDLNRNPWRELALLLAWLVAALVLLLVVRAL